MPTGFGGDNLGANVDAALKGIKIDEAAKSDGLIQAALVAVARVATSNGHPTPVPPEAKATLSASKSSSERSTPSVLVDGGPALLALIAVGADLGSAAGARTRTLLGGHERQDEGVGEEVVPERERGETEGR